VTGIIEQPDIGPLQQHAELLDPGIEGRLVEISLRGSAEQRKSQPRKVSAIRRASFAEFVSGATLT
jgi:hypothetical protein